VHGKGCDDIDVDVHGGLTFAAQVHEELFDEIQFDEEDYGKWCVGFDTCHAGDNDENWNKAAVKAETERLKIQLENYKEQAA